MSVKCNEKHFSTFTENSKGEFSCSDIYADDTLIYVGDTDIDNAALKLQADIINVASWFENNKLIKSLILKLKLNILALQLTSI